MSYCYVFFFVDGVVREVELFHQEKKKKRVDSWQLALGIVCLVGWMAGTRGLHVAGTCESHWLVFR